MKRSTKHPSSAVLIQHDVANTIDKRWRLSARVFSRATLAVIAMGVLFLAPNPAFAQHGGGGHSGGGGGGHASGGGGSHASGGGSHASGGGGSHPSGGRGNSSAGGANGSSHPSVLSRIFHAGSAPSGAPKSGTSAGTSGAATSTTVHAGATNAPGTAPVNTGEPVRVEPPHVTIGFPRTSSGEPVTAGGIATPRSGPLNFSGQGNEIWQEPSASRGSTSTTVRAAGPPRQPVGTTPPEPRVQAPRAPRVGNGVRPPNSFTPTPPRVRLPHPRRPIYPIYPIYPGYPGGGFGWGWPFWGFGWGSYWGTGCDQWWTWGCPNYYYSPPSAPPPDNFVAAAPSDTLLYLKDGTVYDVTDYWLADGGVYYTTTDGIEGSFDVDQLDLERTVNANADRGVTFVLQPAPAPEAAPDAAPAPPDAGQNPPSNGPDNAAPPDSAPPPSGQ